MQLDLINKVKDNNVWTSLWKMTMNNKCTDTLQAVGAKEAIDLNQLIYKIGSTMKYTTRP